LGVTASKTLETRLKARAALGRICEKYRAVIGNRQLNISPGNNDFEANKLEGSEVTYGTAIADGSGWAWYIRRYKDLVDSSKKNRRQ